MMKRSLNLGCILFYSVIFVSQSTANSITLDFRLETKSKRNENIVVIDKKTGEAIHFEKVPSITILDIKRAECRFEELDGYYTSAKSIYDENVVFTDDMIPIINFHLNEQGKKKIAKITSQNVGNRLGIFLNEKFIIAAVIHGKIEGSVFSLEAAGAIGVKESKDLVNKINGSK